MRDILGQLKSIDLKSIDLKAINLTSVDIAGIDKKRVGTAVATLAIALGAGFYMQNEPGKAPALQGPAPQPVQTASVLPTASGDTPEAALAGDETAQMSADNQPAADEQLNLAEVDQVSPELSVVENAPQAVAEAAPELAIEQSDARTEVNQSADLSPAIPSPDLAEEESFDLAALDLEPLAPIQTPTDSALTDLPCAPALTGSAGKMAMISLSVSAPCHANQEIEFSHEGLRFTERLDGQGAISLDLPALAVEAQIVAHLEDDASAAIQISVPDAVQYRRAALIWHGATGLQLHAFEEGADYGDTGHVWAEQPGDLSRVDTGVGGYTTMLGSVSSGYAADVYSFPAFLMRSLSGPEITIEAQIMETTCDKAIEATFLRTNGKKVTTEMPIDIASPGCDAVGEYLVLHDLPETMRLALN